MLKIKKISAFLIAASMLLSGLADAMAAIETKEVLFADFDTNAYQESLTDTQEQTELAEENELLLGKVLKLVGATGYPSFWLQFGDNDIYGAAGKKAIIEFDVRLEGMATAGKHLYMKLYNTSGKATKELLLSSGNGKLYLGNSPEADKLIGTIPDPTEYTRLRLELDLTESAGSISGVYADGVKLNTQSFALTSSLPICGMGFEISTLKTGETYQYAAYIDNFTAIELDSAATYPEKSPLMSKIRLCEGYLEDSRYSDTEEITAALADAVLLVKSTSATQAELDAMDARLNAINGGDILSDTVSINAGFESKELPSNVKSVKSEENASMPVLAGSDSLNPLYNQSLYLAGSNNYYEGVAVSFEDVLVGEAKTGRIISTEFDLLSNGLIAAGSGVVLRFADSSNTNKNIRNIYIAPGNGKMYDRDSTSGNLIGTASNLRNLAVWKHFRVIMELTEEGGKITHIYVDGVDALQSEVAFEDSSFASYDTLKLTVSKKNSEAPFGIYIDNLKVAYTDDGSIPVDRWAIYEAVYKTEEIKGQGAEKLDDEKIAALVAKENAAIEVFNSPLSTQRVINSAAKTLEIANAGCAANVASFEIVKSGGETIDYFAEGTLKSVTVDKIFETTEAIKLIIALYNEAGQLEVVELIDAECSNIDGTLFDNINMPISNQAANGRMLITLWDSKLMPIGTAFDSDAAVDWTVTCFSRATQYTLYMDAEPYIKNSSLYVPAKYTANLYGLNCMTDGDGYRAVSDSGDVLTFSASGAAVNSTTYNTEVKNGVVMIPFEAFESKFGGDVEINYPARTIHFTIRGTASNSAPPAGMITYTPSVYGISYEISGVSENATVEVFTRDSLWRPHVNRSLYWNNEAAPRYENGKFIGGVGSLEMNRVYYFRIKITENGVTTIYDDTTGARTLSNTDTIDAIRPVTNGELLAVPTYENIGYYFDSQESDSIAVSYRKSGGEWQEALTPVYDGVQYRGSVVGLDSGSEYEIKAELNGTAVTTTVTTWSDEPQLGETISLSELYNGTGAAVISGLSGSADSWIKVVNDTDMVIDAKSDYSQALLIDNCEYCIFEGFTVKGGYRHGVQVSDTSSNIRIRNFDISEWGRAGVRNEGEALYYFDGAVVNYDAGIYMLNSNNVTVERCYIHNSKANANAWDSDTWKNVHPKGPCGICYNVKSGAVIRYNDIIGNENHRWNDAIESKDNGSYFGGAGADCDVYGNMFYMGQDDGIELDGGQMNTRFYENRIEQFLCGISTAPNMIGPSYLFRNVVTNMGSSYKTKVGTAIKAGGYTEGREGVQFFINNTIDTAYRGASNIKYGDSSEYHSFSRNNILISRTGRKAFTNLNADNRDDNDYDLLYGEVNLAEGAEANGIIGTLPSYANADNGDLHLASDSVGKNSSAYVPNFSEAGEDVGAYSDNIKFLPYRPIDISANAYSVTITEEECKIVVTAGEIGASMAYKVVTDNEWISITGPEGVISPNAKAEFSLRLNGDGTEENGMVIFRLENGLSIPITVKR